ncbi:hypothetical protein HYV10_01905 [Candidatus Dependentiae bacterium]|nr:hypothetical protein [Candidatus Dependentiae bacterium]
MDKKILFIFGVSFVYVDMQSSQVVENISSVAKVDTMLCEKSKIPPSSSQNNLQEVDFHATGNPVIVSSVSAVIADQLRNSLRQTSSLYLSNPDDLDQKTAKSTEEIMFISVICCPCFKLELFACKKSDCCNCCCCNQKVKNYCFSCCMM